MIDRRRSPFILPLLMLGALAGCVEDPDPTASPTAPIPNETPTVEPTLTPTPTYSVTQTAASTPTTAPTPTATMTPTLAPTPTPTAIPTPTATLIPAVFPGVAIVGPRDGADVQLTGDYALPISFVTSNFATRAAGTCLPEEAPCGHIRVRVDGVLGDQAEQDYNAIGHESPILADFSVLDDPSGLHDIRIEILDDDGVPIEDGDGVIYDSIQVDVSLSPELSITLPDESTVRIGNDEARSVQIPFTLTNFALKAPGECGETPRCGHLRVHVDGASGNQGELPYNNIATSTPALAQMVAFEAPAGPHQITLSLHDDGGNPVEVDGAALEKSVEIQAVEVAPTLSILSPDDGSQVVLNELDHLTLRFGAANFTLAEKGSCLPEDLPDCGYVAIHLDGDAGNPEGQSNHLETAISPATIDFSLLQEPRGSHSIAATLMDNDGEAIVIDGDTIQAEIQVLTSLDSDPRIRIGSPNPGETLALGTDAELTLPLSYTVDNFQIAPPGLCGGAANCGHLKVRIDGDAGNLEGMDYNNLASDGNAGIADAHFNALENPLGNHQISLSLVDNLGAPITIAESPVEVQVDVITEDGKSTIEIVSFEDGQQVRLGNDALKTVPIPYNLEGFVATDLRACTGDEKQQCGSIEIYIDETRVNITGNNPAEAYFAYVEEPTGEHLITLKLVDENGDPLLEDGEPVEDSVTLITQAVSDPFIRLVTPQEGAEILLRTDQYSSTLTYNLTGYEIQAPGEACVDEEGNPQQCGHIRLNIDGDAGNQAGQSFNNISYSNSNIQALFGELENIEGEHSLTLTLFDNQTNEAVTTAEGNAVQAHVNVLVTISDDPIEVPDDASVTILSPLGLGDLPANITLTGDYQLAATFATYAFELAEPGACPPGNGACGHILIHIDGDNGNQAGLTYNSLAWQNPAYVDFSTLNNPAGYHTITMTLADDQGHIIYRDGLPITDEVDVHVDITPMLNIGLNDDAQLTIDNTEGRAANIPFNVNNFLLKTPGTCEGAERCGHIYVHVDGDEGNAPDQNYNNIATLNPATALFGYSNAPVGTHHVTLSLRNDAGEPIYANGQAVEDSVRLHTVASIPTMQILTPLEGAQIPLYVDDKSPVTFGTTRFKLAEPEACLPEDLPDCGFIEVYLDGDAGSVPGLGYNALATSTSTVANFGYLDEPTGYHTISAQLFYHDGNPVLIDGAPITDAVNVFASYPEDPQLNIITPVSNTDLAVDLGTDPLETVLVSYSLTGFTLAEPGTCAGQENCGHLYIRVDGDAGNAPDQPYNNIETASTNGSVDAHFAHLDDPEGAHTITLSLRQDNGEPYLLYGAPLEVSTTITTESVVPTLEIVGLNDGDPVVVGQDVDGSVLVGYQLQNFIQREAGACTGEESEACGYVQVYVDDVINNTSVLNPAQAKFALVDTPLGYHTIHLLVVNNIGQPYLVDGAPLEAHVDVVVQNPGEPYIRIVLPPEGGELTLYGDNYTGFITFVALNITLAEPGQACENPDGTPATRCGYVVVNIDGNAGNRPRRDYNNQWYSQLPAAALFALVDDPIGDHEVSLRLYDHQTRKPITLQSGLTPTDQVNLTTVLPPEIDAVNGSN